MLTQSIDSIANGIVQIPRKRRDFKKSIVTTRSQIAVFVVSTCAIMTQSGERRISLQSRHYFLRVIKKGGAERDGVGKRWAVG
jgi:hypothetical protein